MKILITLAAISLGLTQTPPPTSTAKPSLLERQAMLKSEVAITTLPTADLAGMKAIEHDTEVDRSEAVTVVVTIQGCEADAKGACNASADVVAYKPDGSVHSELKGINLATGRGMAMLKLAPNDALGVYRIEATVRDLTARRFGKTERKFGVK